MRKLHDKHEVWYCGEFETLSELAGNLASTVKKLESEGLVTSVSIDAGDQLDMWSATVIVLPNDHGE